MDFYNINIYIYIWANMILNNGLNSVSQSITKFFLNYFQAEKSAFYTIFLLGNFFSKFPLHQLQTYSPIFDLLQSTRLSEPVQITRTVRAASATPVLRNPRCHLKNIVHIFFSLNSNVANYRSHIAQLIK